ncbi:MAG: hypothetical protein KDD47_26505 [Acidobacteria bacterium]|nr:hypothetical protein [Acidobacteriota bacterium]
MRKLLFLPLVALLTATACSEGNPVAPSGTILTVTASPNRIGRTGSTEIVVTGRKPDGNPIVAGTDIFFSATIGTIERQVEADSNGRAVATLTGDGRIGTAMVTVSLDGTSSGGSGGSGGDGGDGGSTPSTVTGTNSVTISIQVGSTPTLTITINPRELNPNGTAEVTVVARNEDGSAVDEDRVTRLTDNGSLRPSEPRLDSNGIARSTLTAGTVEGGGTVTAFLGGQSQEGTFTIRQTAATLSLIGAVDDEFNRNELPATVALRATVLRANGQAAANIGVQFRIEPSAGISFVGSNIGVSDTAGLAEVTINLSANIPAANNTIEIFAQTPGLPEERGRFITITGGN